MKNIAISGVSGYIGSRLLLCLDKVDEVESIVGIDIKPPKYNSPKLTFYCQDISLPLSDIFVNHRVDTAIHLAFVMKPSHHWKRARKVDVGGTSNFLEACHQAGVKHILYLGSHTIYGANPDNTRPLGEDSPLRPLAGFQYSQDKAEVEQILGNFAAAHRDVRLTILRSCPVIGPNAGGSVVASMFRPIMIRVAGYDPPLQFVHEDDLVKLMITILNQKKAGIFNVASNGDLRYSDMVHLCGRRIISLPEWLLRAVLGLSWILRLQSESPPSGLEFIKYPPVVGTDKLRKETGFIFSHSSREAVASFMSAHL